MTEDFDIKKVLSWATRDEARKYIGKECYLEDTIRELKDAVQDDTSEVLKTIDDNNRDTFINGVGQTFGFLYPKEKTETVIESVDSIMYKARYRFLYKVFDLLLYAVDNSSPLHVCRDDVWHESVALEDGVDVPTTDIVVGLTEELTTLGKQVSYLITRGANKDLITLNNVTRNESQINFEFKIEPVDRDLLINFICAAAPRYIKEFFNL